jgi:hypothetical protein
LRKRRKRTGGEAQGEGKEEKEDEELKMRSSIREERG